MADTGVFATTAQVQSFVPSWASATYNTEAYINTFIADWESVTGVFSGYDFSTNYATLNAIFKKVLGIYVSYMVAIEICDKDISGTDIRTAEFWRDSTTAKSEKLKELIMGNVNLIKTGT